MFREIVAFRVRRSSMTASATTSGSCCAGAATCAGSAPIRSPTRWWRNLLDLACLAPSVGNAQPWRFVSVDDAGNRADVIANFHAANARALAGYQGERAQLYASLKLAGLKEAPRHLAVFCDESTAQGHGLGRQTMPETLRYSAVLAVHTLWLAARTRGVGVGWVSILDPVAAVQQLRVPATWSLVAYLCLGWPVEEQDEPELQRSGWQARDTACRQVLQR
jgi:5,6-dimethylbenzimidazole synthase